MSYQTAKEHYEVVAERSGTTVHTCSRILSLLNAELSKDTDIPFLERLKAYRHGFLSESYQLYDLNHKDQSDDLTDWQRSVHSTRINRPYTQVHENKLLFYHVLTPEYDGYLPHLYGVVKGGTFSPSHLTGGPQFDILQECVDEVGVVVAKPVGGARGDQVMVIERTTDGYQINRQPATAPEITGVASKMDEFIVTEFVHQAAYAERIFSNAGNTIRLMTMIDPKTHEPYVGAAVHRFATEQSTPVDNYSDGGGVANIDIETGELGQFATRPVGDPAVYHDTHPDTDARINGTEIPDWTEIKQVALEIADTLADITPYLGWDLMLTDDGTRIIEANSLPDVHAVQTHQPLLSDERNRRFYEYHNVI